MPVFNQLKSSRWSAPAIKGGPRELLKNRAVTHHGATPVKTRLGVQTIKRYIPCISRGNRVEVFPVNLAVRGVNMLNICLLTIINRQSVVIFLSPLG